MSTIEENVIAQRMAAPARKGESVLSKFLRLLCSVRFGVTLLCLLALACFLGMVIMQQNVDGFENYYAALTPAQKLVYGKLGLFDIYHSWYFNTLLCVLSLNIVLSSVDRFPKTWIYISRPQVAVPVRWLMDQKQTASIEAEGTLETLKTKAETLLRKYGWKRVRTEVKNGRTFVFGESGVWNRLSAYPVHVALLTIFLGGFLTAQLGTTGNLPLAPGESSNVTQETVVELNNVNQITKQLPFEVTFTDIEQKLIKKEGPLSAINTIDWITRFTITDETGTHDAMVQMNRPFDYRGYRFFQASFVSTGRARNITLDVVPARGQAAQRVTIDRNGSTTLADGTKIRFADFRGAFSMGAEDPNEDSSTYPNPAAILQITPPDGTTQTAYAFGPQMASIPIASKPIGGYTYRLADFEKVSDRHILSVQRDPGATVVYVGFALLVITLVGSFFFSHQRVWAMFEEISAGRCDLIVAGNTNKNQNGFDEKFRRFVLEMGTAVKEKEAL
jgi:cytochrome c biogenesis protein